MVSESLKLTLYVLIYFVKVPRPEDSEVSFSVFESNNHLLLPV